MPSPDELITAAYDFLGGRAKFSELYDLALTRAPTLQDRDREGFPSRLAGAVLLAEGEDSSGLIFRDDLRKRIADLLREEALRSLPNPHHPQPHQHLLLHR